MRVLNLALKVDFISIASNVVSTKMTLAARKINTTYEGKFGSFN